MIQGLAIGAKRRTSWTGVLLVALALIVRLSSPDGWMPGLGGTLTLCTAHGAVIFMPDAPMPDDQGKAASHAPCAFSALGELAAAPPPVVLLYAAAIVMVLALWFSPAPPGGDPACVRRQAPRAPPRLFE